jgi:hypothetical protein
MKEESTVATTCSNDTLPRCTSAKMGDSANTTKKIISCCLNLPSNFEKQGHGCEEVTNSNTYK